MSMQSKHLVNSFLNRERSYYRIASRYADDGLVVQQLDGKILWANPAYCDLLGYSLDEILGRNPLSFCMTADDQPSDAFIANFRYTPTESGRDKLVLARNKHASGRAFWMQISTSYHRYDDNTYVVILVCRDVSAQIQKEQQLRKTSADLERLANRDPLTDLANRAALGRFLDETLSTRRDEQTALLQIDLDKFKAINDTHGHAAGDVILCHVAEEIRKVLRKGDFAARLGGDEFVVIFAGVSSLQELQNRGAKLAQAIHTPIDANGCRIACRPSIGAALAHNSEIPAEEILRRADFALYEAKRLGRGQVTAYDQQLHDRHQQEALLAAELIVALDQKSLTYFFQPTMSLRTGKLSGFETLVRWHHPRLGMIPPDHFLPVARRMGLMADVDFGALSAAIKMKQALNNAGHTNLRIGFNGSEELLAHPRFFERLTAKMESHGITSREIVIELLETVVFDDMSQTNPLVATVKRLHDAGFMTLLDDFGTGHAGLTHMAQLAVSGVKIDRSLTTNILTEAVSSKIIAMIIDLCADLNFYVVTEGIETVEEARALVALGGEVIQGYWLSKPMPGCDVVAWVNDHPDISALL